MATANLDDILQAARELAFDRFPTPIMYIKKKDSTHKLHLDNTALVIKDVSDNIVTNIEFSNYDTLQKVFQELLYSSEKYAIAQPAAYKGLIDPSNLLSIEEAVLSEAIPIMLPYLNSYSDLEELLTHYFIYYRKTRCSCENDVRKLVSFLECEEYQHLTLWLAFHMVDKKREQFAADDEIGTVFLNDTDQNLSCDFSGLNGMARAGDISVTIGDVFSLSDSDALEPLGDAAKVGADSVWGDDGFYYRLQNKIRLRFEKRFNDPSLRPNQVIFTEINLEREATYYAYYDSNPFTVSSFTEEILRDCPE
jgi:hypothetical protein